MNNDASNKIKSVFTKYLSEIRGLIMKRKEFLKTYRSKLEEEKIKELKDSLK